MTIDTLQLVVDAIGMLAIPALGGWIISAIRGAYWRGVMETRLGHAETRMTKGDERFSSMDRKLDQIIERLSALEGRSSR